MNNPLVKTLSHIFVVPGLAISLLLPGCEGGVGGTGRAPDNGGASVGAVTSFGSVWVNGVEFDTTNAEIWIEDELIGIGDAAAQTNLAIGHVVEVRGSFNNDGISGTAISVSYSDALEGPIASLGETPAGSGIYELWVMGYTVIVDGQTTLDSGLLMGDLAAGDVVEISGLPDESGRIRATFLEKDNDPFINYSTEVEVKGVIQNLTPTTFTIGGLTVDFSTASTLPSEPLANNQWVEIKGSSFSPAGEFGLNGSVFSASSVELEDNTLTVSDGEHVELEGYITSGLISSEFVVGNQIIRITSGTVFENGSAANLVAGERIEAEGSWSNGKLVAEEIKFE